MTARRPPLTTSRSYRRLHAHYGSLLLTVIRSRRASGPYPLRDALASLVRDLRRETLGG